MKVLLMMFAAVAAVMASPTYIGYSGAPGSQGPCAGQCHGSSGGTITVSGFPSYYIAGQTYVIAVEHNGGASISNFNASVRDSVGRALVGTLTAGTNTEIYSTPGEEQGAHFRNANENSGSFSWTAPNPPVGKVKLYLAGHQGSFTGANTEIELISQGTGISEVRTTPRPKVNFSVQPTIATDHLVLRVDSHAPAARIRITDNAGRVVHRLPVGNSPVIIWSLRDKVGRRLVAGTYHAVLESGPITLSRRFAVR